MACAWQSLAVWSSGLAFSHMLLKPVLNKRFCTLHPAHGFSPVSSKSARADTLLHLPTSLAGAGAGAADERRGARARADTQKHAAEAAAKRGTADLHGARHDRTQGSGGYLKLLESGVAKGQVILVQAGAL